MPSFSQKSKDKQKGVHPDLLRVVNTAIKITDQDFMITCGVRTPEEQKKLYGQGRTRAQLIKMGVDPDLSNMKLPTVTWNLVSNHFVKADGYGHAIDLCPYPVDWEGPVKFPKFEKIAEAMKEAARIENVKIRWGGDWTKNKDRPHFELVK